MDQETAPAARRRLGAHGMAVRRRRIFAHLREGSSYEEIAAEEGVSRERVRQIVAEALRKRAVDSGAEHAKLQLERLAPAVQLGAEAVAGDVSAITPYLKALDRLDRYQSVAVANQAYDDDARKKLIAKLNRIAANLGVDEVMRAAAREHLRKIGAIKDEGRKPEADGPAGDEQAGEGRGGEEHAASEAPRQEAQGAWEVWRAT
jgi:DNA-directed RNA polymerase specialized sigma24 family protein